MKTLIVHHTADLGGATFSLAELLARFPATLMETVVVLPAKGPAGELLEGIGVRTLLAPHPWWVTAGGTDAWLYAMRKLPQAVDDLRNVIRRERPDLVWTTSTVAPCGAFAAAIEDRPHLWWIQEFLEGEGQAGPLDPATLRGVIVGLSSDIIAISSALAADYRGHHGADLHLLPAGIDCTRYEALGGPSAEPQILTIGTNSSAKGLGDFVEALGRLKSRRDRFKAVVVGECYYPDYLREIKARAHELGIDDCIEYRPFQQDIRPSLAAAAVYCCPSRTEGMSRVVLEAMASGLPVVSTDCGGPRDLIEDGRSGVLVPVGDVAALAEALDGLLADRERASALGMTARRRAKELFDLSATAQRYAAVLEKAGSAKASAAAFAPFCTLVTEWIRTAGPRVLLGKKWRMLKPLLK